MHNPFVSVIMPIRNEADFITQSLSAVLSQDYQHTQMEILIADGMSTDDTRSIIDTISTNSDIPISILDNPCQIVPTGLNIALKHTRGEIIVRVDGHCKIAPDYVSRCVEHLLSKDIAGVGGPIQTIAATPAGETIAIAMSSPFGVGGSAFRTIKGKSMPVDTIAFPAYTREAIDLAGPFDEDLKRNQDDEYNYRLRKLNQTLLLASDVRSEYYSRSSFKKLWRQYFQYGYYKVRVMQKHPRQMRLRQFVPPIFVLALLGNGVLALFISQIFWLWLLIIISYILANLTASLITASRTEWQHLLLLPFTFATLHISYGLGFLSGLIMW